MHKDVCHWNSACNNEKQKANPDTHQQKFHKQWHNHTRSATQPSKKNGNQPIYKYYSLSTWVIHSVSRSVIFNYQQYTLKIQGKNTLKIMLTPIIFNSHFTDVPSYCLLMIQLTTLWQKEMTQEKMKDYNKDYF